MYQKKKLALFISHIYGEYQKGLCQGFIQQATDYGYPTEIYATNDGENLGDYGLGEDSILQIPKFSNFDGVVFAASTYSDPAVKEKIAAHLKEITDCPIVEITDTPSDFPAISLENNVTAGELTEHLITVHHCRRICYLGCLAERYYSDGRQNYWMEKMQKYSLPISEHDIYLCDDTEEDFERALAFFTRDGSEKPDAIVCYNDRVAIGFWTCALRKGYRIPQDFAITGCDCSSAGQHTDPPLTTVTFPLLEVGQTAVNLLVQHAPEDIPKQTWVRAKPVYAGSCGCHSCNDAPALIYQQQLASQIADAENSMFISMQMSAEFSHITDIDRGMDVLEKYVRMIPNCQEFYLCLYSDWNSLPSHIHEITNFREADPIDEDPNIILLKLAIKDGKRLPECSFSRVSLLPTFLQKASDSVYLVAPLFFETRAFGYIVMSFSGSHPGYDFRVLQWFTSITQLLQNIHESTHTRVLTRHLEEIYMKDMLTGLYNQHGFQHYQKQLLESAKEGDYISAMLFDLDNLKMINDTHGHKEGDFALKVVGQALDKTSTVKDVCARFSGDEFYVLTRSQNPDYARDFIAGVATYLKNFNKLSPRSYAVDCSGGYAVIPYKNTLESDDLTDLFSRADESMYETKKRKHAH